MLDGIERSRTTTLPRLIYALGIANIGVANAKLLCKYLDYDIDKMRNADVETLSAIEGIGEVIASAYVAYMRKEENITCLEHLLKELTIKKPQNDGQEQNLAGMSFVITGSLSHFANRNDLKEIIEARGGKVTGSVTGKTTALINNDVTSNSSKNKKAKELGVEIISEDAFLLKFEIEY